MNTIDSPHSSEWKSHLIAGVKRWALAAVAAMAAETVTFPIDVAKTRLQLQNELVKNATEKLGMVSTLLRAVKTEGLGIYRGLGAATTRQAVYGGIGVGLYAPVRNMIIGSDKDAANAPLWKRIIAGMMTGGVGQAVASPTDVVKVRLQADGRLIWQGKTPRYKGTVDAFVRIWREEGVAGYYRGIGPSVQRAAVINGAGIASYDHTKQIVMRALGTDEGLTAKVFGSLVSGLVSALVSSPFDVIKTRLMNQTAQNKLYKGPLHCALRTVQTEGILALYKGFLPAYSRLAPWQLVFFITFEEINKLASIAQL